MVALKLVVSDLHLADGFSPLDCFGEKLCLLDPALLLEVAQRTMHMLSYAYKAHANLLPGEENNPLRLFEETMFDFLTFRNDMQAQKLDWQVMTDAVSSEDMQEYFSVCEALSLPKLEAVAALCTFSPAYIDDVAAGSQRVLKCDPNLRYAIAGHTHMLRIDLLEPEMQLFEYR